MVFFPELTVLGTGLVFFVLSLVSQNQTVVRKTAVALYALMVGACLLSLRAEGQLFADAYTVDFFSQLFKTCIAVAALIVVIISAQHDGIKEKYLAEYHLFQAMSVLGLMMLVSSTELLAVFIALELSSFAVYIMVPIRHDHQGRTFIQMEAGIKYLLFGVVATGFMLFGMSYIFGLTGSTQLSAIIDQLPGLLHVPAVVVAAAMILAGFFYKLALFPFHFWVPDVYEGAANETTAFIAAVPKIAAVAILIRFITLFDIHGDTLTTILGICAVASMFYGNLTALVQKDLKRMLGFSGIAHAGFVLLGLLTFQTTGYATALYYIVGYAVMNLACFLVIIGIAKEGNNIAIEDLSGLYKRSPLLAITLLIALFSLAGIPPFVGFTGKFMLLVNAFKEGYYLLVILAAINTAIGIYYYLSVVRLAFCTSAEDKPHATAGPLGLSTQVISVALLIVIIGMGVLPSQFIDVAQSAIAVMQ